MSEAGVLGTLAAAAAVLLLAAPASADEARGAGFCAADPAPPAYYAFPLITTKNVPGTAAAEGTAGVHFGDTPYGVALAPDGSFLYDLDLSIRDLPEPRSGAFVAWVTTPSLDRIERVGALSPDGTVEGTVRWNKFLVVVTLEPEEALASSDGGDGAHAGSGRNGGTAARAGDAWTGPIVLRGMSRSGMMHTMAGHGPFQQENCAAYGF